MARLFHIARLLAVTATGLLLACGGRSGSRTPAAKPSPSSLPPEAKPECAQCAIEDVRAAAHADQIVISARYFGVKSTWLDGRRTHRRCTRDEEVMGVVRFKLMGDNPWQEQIPASKTIEVELPCPGLSRSEYARLYRYDPDDTQRDGLGHAPVLQPGALYRLTFVRDARAVMREPSHVGDGSLVLTLVAVNPAGR